MALQGQEKGRIAPQGCMAQSVGWAASQGLRQKGEAGPYWNFPLWDSGGRFSESSCFCNLVYD